MRLRCAPLLALAVVSAACATDSTVSSVRADPSTDVLTDWTTVVPGGTVPDPAETNIAPRSSEAAFADGPIVEIPADLQAGEFAIHALIGDGDGWLAAGSSTAPGARGTATVSAVDQEGTFASETTLPTPEGFTSVARDGFADDAGAFIVGSVGSGRQSVPTTWWSTPGGEWATTPLPIDLASTFGAIADRVVRLDDGTIVVVGRGDGPFFSKLMLWWSADGGATWRESPTDARSFLEPLVATDGRRVALYLRSYPDEESGLAGHETFVAAVESGVLTKVAGARSDLTPGTRYWPNDLRWDGTNFVMALQADISAALATSPDGVNFGVTELDPPGLPSGVPSGAIGVANWDGSVVVLIDQQSMLTLFRWDGVEMVPIDIPPTPSGELEFLAARRLLSSDGARFGYIAADWDLRTMLIGDADGWTSGPIEGLAVHRNPSRVEIRDMATAAGAQLALVASSWTFSPGRFESSTVGVLWRAPDGDRWEAYPSLPDNSRPSAITSWQGAFIVVGHDVDLDRSTMFEFDANSGATIELGSLDGFVPSIVADAGHLYARVDDTVGGSALWYSSDGVQWDIVDLGFDPRVLCGDGATAAVEWMVSDGGVSSMGTARLDGAGATSYSSPFSFDMFQVVPEQEQTIRCGVNERGVITTLKGFDRVIASETPHARVVDWIPPPTSIAEIVQPMSDAGAWISTVMTVRWNGSRWVAVGSGKDVESGHDALLWHSTDGLAWDPPITIAGGPGNQTANTVVFDDGTMRIGGFDGTNAVIWTLPA